MQFFSFTRIMFILFLLIVMAVTLFAGGAAEQPGVFSAGAVFGLVVGLLLLTLLDALGSAVIAQALQQNGAKRDLRGSQKGYPANIHAARLARMLGLVPDAFIKLKPDGHYRFVVTGGSPDDLGQIKGMLLNYAGKRPPGGTTPLYDGIEIVEQQDYGYPIMMWFDFYLYWNTEPDLERLILNESPIIGRRVMMTPPEQFRSPATNDAPPLQ